MVLQLSGGTEQDREAPLGEGVAYLEVDVPPFLQSSTPPALESFVVFGQAATKSPFPEAGPRLSLSTFQAAPSEGNLTVAISPAKQGPRPGEKRLRPVDETAIANALHQALKTSRALASIQAVVQAAAVRPL